PAPASCAKASRKASRKSGRRRSVTSSSARRSWPRRSSPLVGRSGRDVSSGVPPHLWGGQVGMSALASLPTGGEVRWGCQHWPPSPLVGRSGGDVSTGLPPPWWGGQVGMSALASLPTGGEVRWGCQHWPSSPLVGRSGGDVSTGHLRGYPRPGLIDFQDGHARAGWLRFIAR